MKTITISITYDVNFWVSDTHCITRCGRIINVKKGVGIKQFLRGKNKAVYIDGVIHFIDELKPIQRNECPF
jgi:hypothetical protein